MSILPLYFRVIGWPAPERGGDQPCIQGALIVVTQNRTTFVIAHRLNNNVPAPT